MGRLAGWALWVLLVRAQETAPPSGTPETPDGTSTVQVAHHFKTRLREPSFLKLEEHGASKPWVLGDGSIWQHTRLWLHPDVPNLMGFAFSESSVTSQHMSVQVSLNFTHADYMLPDSFVAMWIVPPETMDLAVSAQASLFKKADRTRADQFPLWVSAGGTPPKLTGLMIVMHRSSETAHVGVKMVDLAKVSGNAETMGAAFSAKDPKLSFNPAKSPQLRLSMLYAKGTGADKEFPRVQAWAQPGGDAADGKWTELLSADSQSSSAASEVEVPSPLRIGFTSFSGASALGSQACGVQVTDFHVYTYEKGNSDEGGSYLGGLQGRVSEEALQLALKGINDDVKSEYGKHVDVIAKTREQLQRLEKQVSTMEARVDGFSMDKPTEKGSAHGLLHAFKEAKTFVKEQTDKMREEIEKAESPTGKSDKDTLKELELVVENLDSAATAKRSSSTWTLLFLLIVACGCVGGVYNKMQKYEKRHHL